MSGWRDMATAPRDGTAVWLACAGDAYIGYCEPASWLREKETWFLKATFRRRQPEDDYQGSDRIFSTHAVDVLPTHWQPLPEPPPA